MRIGHLIILPLSSIFLGTMIFSCQVDNSQSNIQEALENGFQAIENEEYSKAISIGREAISLSQRINDTTSIIESNYIVARSHALSGAFDSAVSYAEDGSQLCQLVKEFDWEYKLNNILSWSYFSLGKSFDETRDHQQRQLFVVEQLDDDLAKALVYNNYGYDGTVSGVIPLDEAISYTKIANDIYAKAEGTRGRWYTLMNLTWQHRLINDLEKSKYYGELAVVQAEKDSDRHAIIEANTNLGQTLMVLSEVGEVSNLFERGLEQAGVIEDRDKFVFDVYYSKYLWEMGRTNEALTRIKGAIAVLKNGEIFYEMLARSYLIGFAFEQGDVDEVNRQLEVFDNPRASYYSQESKVLVGIIAAKVLATTDKDKAANKLNELEKQVEISQAVRLKQLIEEAKLSIPL